MKTFKLPEINDVIQMNTEIGRFKLVITHYVEFEYKGETITGAKGKRWNDKKGIWSKSSHFVVSEICLVPYTFICKLEKFKK